MDDFEDIRPYHDAEVGRVLERLTEDHELTSFLGQWLAPGLSSVMPGRVASVVSWLLRKKFSSVAESMRIKFLTLINILRDVSM